MWWYSHKSTWRTPCFDENEVTDAEAAQPLHPDKEYSSPVAFTRDTYNTHSSRLWYANVALSIFSCILLLSTWRLRTTRCAVPNDILRQTSAPSPIFDALDISISTKRMNGTLMPADPVPIYRQPPSAEVDAAWDRISTRNPIVIDKADIIAMNKDPLDAAKWPDEWFGPEKYIGKLDVLHQIHCLDRIRRSLYWNFDHYYAEDFPAGTPVDKYHTYHVDHCVYMLLQNIQCHADVDVYPSKWLDAQVHAFPDFNIEKKCRNFDAILDWQEKNGIAVEEVMKVRPVADSRIHRMNREFKQMVHWYEDHPDDGTIDGEIG